LEAIEATSNSKISQAKIAECDRHHIPLHLEVTKEASAATDGVSPVKHHKRKVVARQRNNNYRYGNVWGYAQAYRNDPRGFFIH
jgi:hypothetical protein